MASAGVTQRSSSTSSFGANAPPTTVIVQNRTSLARPLWSS